MTDTCPNCAGASRQQALKEIYVVLGSQICRCTSCGANWLDQDDK